MEVENTHQFPWLAYHHGDDEHRCRALCKISSSGPMILNEHESRYIPDQLLHKKKVLYCSPDGICLLLSETEFDMHAQKPQLWIWSPITQKSIELPCLSQDSSIEEGLLSSSPADPNCLILLFTVDVPVILYCRVGDQNWSEFNYAETIKAKMGSPQVVYLKHPVTFDGIIYATTVHSNLVQIQVDDDDHLSMVVSQISTVRPGQEGHYMSGTLTFLVSLDHHLYLVVLSNRPFAFEYQAAPGISVYTFDFPRMCWKSVTSLNGGALFLGKSYSLSCQPQPQPDDHHQWSYIYFTSPSRSQSSQAMFAYRVEDERITSYLPFPTKFIGPWDSHWIIVSPAGEQSNVNATLVEKQCNLPKEGSQRKNGSGMVPWKRTRKNGTRMVQSQSQSQSQSTLCDLPREVLAVIAGNLSSFIDYIHFRCVNKFCASSTIEMRSRRTNPFQPCLIYRDKVKNTYNLIDSNLNQKLSFKIPEVLNDYRICCSKDGWLLLMERRKCFTFFNPFTMQLLPITEIRKDVSLCGYGISNFTFVGNPRSSNLLVLAMSLQSKQGVSSVAETRTGIATWKRLISGKGDLISVRQSRNSPVVVGDECFYLGKNGKLLSVKRKNEDGLFQWRFVVPVSPCPHFTHNHLSEWGDTRIVSIFMGEEGENSWVRVFKMELKKLEWEWEWEEIFSLGGYSLYLSWPSSICFFEARPKMANRIYFPRFYKDGLVYYCLNTRRYHSMGNIEELQNFYGTSMHMDCAWIQPSWS